MTSLEPGQEILGKYRVERVLGRGGMGTVVRAAHVELGTPVALKVLSGGSATAPDTLSRFLREAQAASSLRSEFVARVTDFGRLGDGRPFMVLELLEGADYQDVIARGPVPIEEAVDAAVQTAAALAEAHAAGIVHRDIKPSNLFRTVRPDGSLCVKVLDFGISKVVDPTADKSLTASGHVLGTPLYMSPEQVRSPRDIDARTDVWSLGAVLYEMLSGEPPFHADTIGELFARILETKPLPIAARRSEVPPELAAVVEACLEKDRERRVPGMRELAELLAPFASSEGAVAARRAGVAGVAGAAGGRRPGRHALVMRCDRRPWSASARRARGRAPARRRTSRDRARPRRTRRGTRRRAWGSRRRWTRRRRPRRTLGARRWTSRRPRRRPRWGRAPGCRRRRTAPRRRRRGHGGRSPRRSRWWWRRSRGRCCSAEGRRTTRPAGPRRTPRSRGEARERRLRGRSPRRLRRRRAGRW